VQLLSAAGSSAGAVVARAVCPLFENPCRGFSCESAL